MKTRSYREILEDFKRARQWLESHGIRVEHTRFYTIQRDLENLVEAAETKEIGRFDNPNEFKAGVYCLLEAEDLIRIHNAYAKRSGPEMIKRLKVAVKGPRSGTDETIRNNKARNVLAELSWGALLELSKYSTSVEHDPDVLQILDATEGSSFLWEVKRPLSLENMHKLLKKGADQIEKASQGKKNIGDTTPIGGCIVVIVDEIFGVKHPVLRTRNGNYANTILRKELFNWWKRNKKSFNDCWRPGVLGVVLWWRLLGEIQNDVGTRVLTDCHQRLLDDCIGAAEDWKLNFLRTIFKTILI